MSATLRSFTDFIFQSRLRALGVAFAVAFVPLISSFGIIIAGLVTLRKGALEGFWVALAASMPNFILLYFQHLPENIRIAALCIVCLLTIGNFFTWAFAALLNRFGNWNLVLEVTALIGIIIVTTAHVVKPDLESWWTKQLTTFLSLALPSNEAKAGASATNATEVEKATTAPAKLAATQQSENDSELGEESTEPDLISFVSAIKPYATGLLAISLLLSALVQLFIARWWQLSLFNSRQLTDEMYHIRLSPMAGTVFLVAIILSYLKIALAQDMLPVLYLTFFIAGLSLAHYAIAKIKTLHWLLLIVFYGFLLCSWMVYHLPLAFQLIAMIALLDVWFDWRERLDRRFP